jgi:hypothetical protein
MLLLDSLIGASLIDAQAVDNPERACSQMG